jgi:hypothetical protein
MAKGGIIGEIVHTAGVRYRTRGTGVLRTRLYNLDQERAVDLNNISLTSPSAKEKTIIANFQDQGVQISFRTIHIDEVFTVTKIVCFVKPVAESYPIRDGG